MTRPALLLAALLAAWLAACAAPTGREAAAPPPPAVEDDDPLPPLTAEEMERLANEPIAPLFRDTPPTPADRFLPSRGDLEAPKAFPGR